MGDDILTGALESALKPHLDEDTYDYITSLLGEDPYDADAREAVSALVVGAVEDHEGLDGEHLCQSLFSLLDLGKSQAENDPVEVSAGDGSTSTLRKLDQAVTMKEHDVQTFASGLRADSINDDKEEAKESDIASFYANMIDISNSAAVSERARRKARQKELRLKLEEEERQRAIQEAMAMLEIAEAKTESVESMIEKSSDNAQDVHFKNLDLPNLRGGGPNLLQGANVTFARGRRYGYVCLLCRCILVLKVLIRLL